MDTELIFAILCGVLLNGLVLYHLIKHYKNIKGIILRFGLFLLLESFLVFSLFKRMFILTFIMLLALAFYIISLAFRSSSDKKTSTTYEFAKNNTSSDKSGQNEQIYQPKKKNNNERYTLKCPNCKSTDIEFIGNNRKSFSVGKAIGGAALTGGIGTLAGFTGKKGSDQWHCKNCGNIFETKKRK